MINLFCGYDQRESIGFHVFVSSVLSRATKPVAFIPLSSMGMPEGSNTFTQSRFLVPQLMGYRGHAIFADASDMIALGDVAELDALFDPRFAVQVVRHAPYKTAHKTKYRGTSMECPNRNYPRKNWASVCIFNCEHPAWQALDVSQGFNLLELGFLADEEIGGISGDWNRLVDEGHSIEGQLLHWTAGVPGFPFYKDAPGADLWRFERQQMERAE